MKRIAFAYRPGIIYRIQIFEWREKKNVEKIAILSKSNKFKQMLNITESTWFNSVSFNSIHLNSPCHRFYY